MNNKRLKRITKVVLFGTYVVKFSLIRKFSVQYTRSKLCHHRMCWMKCLVFQSSFQLNSLLEVLNLVNQSIGCFSDIWLLGVGIRLPTIGWSGILVRNMSSTFLWIDLLYNLSCFWSIWEENWKVLVLALEETVLSMIRHMSCVICNLSLEADLMKINQVCFVMCRRRYPTYNKGKRLTPKVLAS